MKRNNGAASRKNTKPVIGMTHDHDYDDNNNTVCVVATTTQTSEDPVKVDLNGFVDDSNDYDASASDRMKTMMLRTTTTTEKKKISNNDNDNKHNKKEQWTAKHWFVAVLVPAFVFLTIVLVSNSSYGKTVEEVTAMIAEKETLMAEDPNVSVESSSSSSSSSLTKQSAEAEALEAIDSRVNEPTEEERMMEDIRTKREERENEDAKSDITRAKRVSDSCAYFEQQASLQYFFKNRCDFDADARMINPADKSEKPGQVKLEFIALAAYLEGFSYIEHKRISDKKAGEVLSKRAEAETQAAWSEGKIDDDQRDTEEHVLQAAIMQSPPPPTAPSAPEVVEETESEILEEEEEKTMSAEEQIKAAEEQLAHEEEEKKTQVKKKWQFWKNADQKIPSSRASDADLLAMQKMEEEEEEEQSASAAETGEGELGEDFTGSARRMLLKKKAPAGGGEEGKVIDQTEVKQAEPNAMVGPKPYKAIVIGQRQAAFGMLIARSFKTLQMPAITEIYEGDPTAFNKLVELAQKDAKTAGAGDVRVKQEMIGLQNGMHDIELTKEKDDVRKGLTKRTTMSVPMITGDSLVAQTKQQEKTIVLHMGEEHVKDVVKGFQKTLNHGGRIGGPVSTPRIVFFRAKSLKEASEAFKGLPFQVFIVGKPRENSAAGRPFLMRIDGIRYNEHLDSIKDDMTYLVMALHHNDPYIDVAFSEGATVCDPQCNCFTSQQFRKAAPVCAGHHARLENFKDHTWQGPKNKAKIRHSHLFGSDGRGGTMKVQENVESAILNRIDTYLNKDLPSLDTVASRDWLSEGLKRAEDERNGAGAPKTKSKKSKKKPYVDEFTNEDLLRNPLKASGYSWSGGNGFAGAGANQEKDVRLVDFRRKDKQKNSKHIN
jgi:hypothetical protein